MRNVKRLALPLLLVAGSPTGAAWGGDRVAPAVVRKPPTATNAPAAPPSGIPLVRTSPASEEAYFSALAASQGSGGDPILDKGLMRAMSRLMAAGRCNDALKLATQNGQTALAASAKQVCKIN